MFAKTTEDYNLIADDFSRTRGHAWQGLRLLSEYAKPGDRVLDLGCGNGRLLELLKDRKINYLGVDSASNIIELARRKHPHADFRTADALNLPFPDACFDKIYSIALLHHIPSEELRLVFLKEAKRVLKPEGMLLLTVWNLWQRANWKTNLKYAVLKIAGLSKLDFKDILVPWGKSHKRYFHCFSEKELGELVRKAGLRPEKSGILQGPDSRRSNIYLIVKKPHQQSKFPMG